MSNYNTFAQFYDKLTENVEYKVRADYVSDFFSSYEGEVKTVLDLACGTGNISYYLSERGYKITGLDLSEDMLSVASSKNIEGLLLLKGDMKNFYLPQKYDCCICLLDSINHLENIQEVEACFECVYKSLNEGGLFIFDVNTINKHKNILAGNTFVFDEDDFYLVWDNEGIDNSKVRILLDLFVYNGMSYDRYSEEFVETAYNIEELKKALIGFDVLGIYDDLTLNSPTNESERIYFVCKRK